MHVNGGKGRQVCWGGKWKERAGKIAEGLRVEEEEKEVGEEIAKRRTQNLISLIEIVITRSPPMFTARPR